MITLVEFALEAATAGVVYSRHYDEVVEAVDLCQATGRALFEQAMDLLDSTAAAFQAEELVSPNHLLVFVPLPSSKFIDLLEHENWDVVRVGQEPPGLYAIYGEDVFGFEDEEYRRPVDGLVRGSDRSTGAVANFRSWRSAPSRPKGEEFENGVYLIWNKASVDE